jgi:hypothetical protein
MERVQASQLKTMTVLITIGATTAFVLYSLIACVVCIEMRNRQDFHWWCFCCQICRLLSRRMIE